MFARSVAFFAFALFLGFANARTPSEAIPIFAQRYRLSCETCHTAIPELNAFGNAFRDGGYRLESLPRYGTTVAALRYNLEWERDPVSGSRRFTPAASLVADRDVGRVNACLHYNFGAGGAPAAPFLGFLSTYDSHTRSLYRAGLFEVPLTQSPGQRLDSITTYGYFATSVGQNDLDLNAPRLGIEAERGVGVAKLFATLAFGEFKGAAYGGKPVFTGGATSAGRPEIGLYARVPISNGLTLNAQLIDGSRRISLPGGVTFDDPYDRAGFGAEGSFFAGRLDLTVQQWLGRDNDADGANGAIDSSGGYARLKYFVTPHAYFAARYDAAANPFAARTLLFYAGTLVGKHARVLLEERSNLIHGGPTLGGYFTFAAPWPKGL